MRNSIAGLLIVWLSGLGVLAPAQNPYSPLELANAPEPARVDRVVHDAARDRDIPIRLYLPEVRTGAPVLLYSHGLGGSRETAAYLGLHWAKRGYVAVFLQHPGSDESLWKDRPVRERMGALRSAADWTNLKLRIDDAKAILDELQRLNGLQDDALCGRLDLKRVGMSGHSFGAVTTQALAGQTYPLIGSLADPRIKAALIMSPSSPRRGDREIGKPFASVRMPWLLMTGTKDLAPIGDQDVASRLAVYEELPPGKKYELVLDGAQHSAFTDRGLAGEKGGRNPNHHRAILALSTAFWDAYLREDPAAAAWLDGEEPRRILEAADVWKRK